MTAQVDHAGSGTAPVGSTPAPQDPPLHRPRPSPQRPVGGPPTSGQHPVARPACQRRAPASRVPASTIACGRRMSISMSSHAYDSSAPQLWRRGGASGRVAATTNTRPGVAQMFMVPPAGHTKHPRQYLTCGNVRRWRSDGGTHCRRSSSLWSRVLCRLRFGGGVWFAIRWMVGEPLQRVAVGTCLATVQFPPERCGSVNGDEFVHDGWLA
jgi:hypothetical protein